ncbi:MAG TPA: penicillin-binding protein 2 [Thermoanaerobaculia bacterium]|jgi:penicillin-binding protein 2
MLKVRDDRRELTRRIELSRIFTGAVFSVLTFAYWYIQIVQGDRYFELSENNRIRSVKVTAPRGHVLDREGRVLAENEPAYNLQLYRREARNLETSIAFASQTLGLPPEQVRARVERGLRDPEFLPIAIAENLGLDEVARIEARMPEHPEFAIAISQRRLYRRGGEGAHALGYLSEASPDQIRRYGGVYRLGDWIGQKGIEASYERLLAGVNGERRVVVDSYGREMDEENRIEAEPGQNLFVTLDAELQTIAEDYFRTRVGAAVAMDPATGEILAMASSPGYDPNTFTRRVTAAEWSALTGNPDHPLQNRAVQNAHAPGSVLKVFLAYGALAHREVDPSAVVFCPGQATYYGRVFRCHKKGGHGWVNLRNAIKVSCDVYFYNLGRRLGIDRIAEYARAFGFGEPTGIDLAFERSGLVPSEKWALEKRKARWYPSETISVSIGQGPILATPIQVARALAGLVRGGTLPTPHLFLASQDPATGSRLRYEAESKPSMTIDPAGLALVKDGMWAVVNEPGGTAFGSRVPGLDAAGKTGTVQVVGREAVPKAGTDRRKLEDHAWFAAFAPLQDPRLVVVVFVEHGGHGSSAAAPLAKQLFAKRFGVALPPEPPPALRAQAREPTDPALASAAVAEARQ